MRIADILRSHGIGGGAGISPGDNQALINVTNAADANNDTIKANVITKVNNALGLAVPAGSTWTTVTNAIVKDPDKISGNIRAGVNIDGVVGKTEVVDTTTAVGAAVGEVLTGKEVFVNGIKRVGTMPAFGVDTAGTNVNGTLTAGRIYIQPPSGYWNGAVFTYFNDPDFIAANIKKDVNMFGLIGTYAGKQFATGQGTTDGAFRLNVTGLSFTPSIIMAIRTTKDVMAIYNKNLHATNSYGASSGQVMGAYAITTPTTGSFSIYCMTNLIVMDWIAIE